MRWTKRVALGSVALLVLASCSGSPAAQGGDRTRLGDANKANNSGKGKKQQKKVLEKAAEIGKKAGSTSGSGDTVSGSKAAGKPPTTATTSQVNPAYARRTSVVDDPNSDGTKEGITPSYAEITKASIIGLGEDFRMTLTLDGAVPDQMPNDKTHMIIAFGMTGSGNSDGYSFGAQCTQEGWNAYAGGRDDGNGEFPGTFFVKGNTIEMTVPWDYVEGPRAFEWYAASNWFSQLANQTHYRVDLAPSEGLAKFPQ
jgi:hypothetical protein